MSTTFPIDPELNQLHPKEGEPALPNGLTYYWDGETWNILKGNEENVGFVKRSGDTMTGPLLLANEDGSPQVPVDGREAVNFAYLSNYDLGGSTPPPSLGALTNVDPNADNSIQGDILFYNNGQWIGTDVGIDGALRLRGKIDATITSPPGNMNIVNGDMFINTERGFLIDGWTGVDAGTELYGGDELIFFSPDISDPSTGEWMLIVKQGGVQRIATQNGVENVSALASTPVLQLDQDFTDNLYYTQDIIDANQATTETNIANLNNRIIELEEELESVAPSIERGEWTYSSVDAVPPDGKYYIADADGNPTQNFEDTVTLYFANKDGKDVDHKWDNVEVDEYIDLFDSQDDDFFIAQIKSITIEAEHVVFGVELVQARGEDDGNPIRIKIFKVAEGDGGGADLDQYVRKAGDTMTGTLVLKKDNQGLTMAGGSRNHPYQAINLNQPTDGTSGGVQLKINGNTYKNHFKIAAGGSGDVELIKIGADTSVKFTHAKGNQFHFNNNRISELGTAIDDTDAISLGQVKELLEDDFEVEASYNYSTIWPVRDPNIPTDIFEKPATIVIYGVDTLNPALGWGGIFINRNDADGNNNDLLEIFTNMGEDQYIKLSQPSTGAYAFFQYNPDEQTSGDDFVTWMFATSPRMVDGEFEGPDGEYVIEIGTYTPGLGGSGGSSANEGFYLFNNASNKTQNKVQNGWALYAPNDNEIFTISATECRIKHLQNPSSADHAANKSYVDAQQGKVPTSQQSYSNSFYTSNNKLYFKF